MSTDCRLVDHAVAYASAASHLDDSRNELNSAAGALAKAQDEVRMKQGKVQRAEESATTAWKALVAERAKAYPEKMQPLETLMEEALAESAEEQRRAAEAAECNTRAPLSYRLEVRETHRGHGCGMDKTLPEEKA
jgi:transketolase